MKRKLTAWVLCLVLCAVTVLFASCRKTGNDESSNNGMDLSSDMSKVESDVSGAMSDITSGLSSFFDPDESSSLSSASSDEAAPILIFPDLINSKTRKKAGARACR